MKAKALLVLVVLAVLAGSSLLYAWEPPRLDIRKGIQETSLAFTARIIRLEEKQIKDLVVVSEAKLQLLDCHYGIDCNEFKTVTLRYVNLSITECVDGVVTTPSFDLSDTVLILLRNQKAGPRLTLDSSLEDGVDYAFVVSRTFPTWPYKKETMFLHNAYYFSRRNPTEVKLSDFNSWMKKRAMELQEKQEKTP